MIFDARDAPNREVSDIRASLKSLHCFTWWELEIRPEVRTRETCISNVCCVLPSVELT